MDIELAKKLLRVALDRASSDTEAENAGLIFIRGLRRDGVTYDQMSRGLAGIKPEIRHVETIRVVQGVPGEDLRLTFGKHKGRRLADVFANDAGYVEWMVENCDALPDVVRRAAEELLESV